MRQKRHLSVIPPGRRKTLHFVWEGAVPGDDLEFPFGADTSSLHDTDNVNGYQCGNANGTLGIGKRRHARKKNSLTPKSS